MEADFFTKPLQGSLFRKFSGLILDTNTDPSTDSSQDHRSVLGQDQNHTSNIQTDR